MELERRRGREIHTVTKLNAHALKAVGGSNMRKGKVIKCVFEHASDNTIKD